MSVKDKFKHYKVVNVAGKLIDTMTIQKTRHISVDASHPLNAEFELLPFGLRFMLHSRGIRQAVDSWQQGDTSWTALQS